MQDALKLAEEAINALLPSDINGPIWKMHAANVALSAIRAARAEWCWRKIEEAKDGVKLDQVGCHYPGNPSGWLRGSGYCKREAVAAGFTYFLMYPPPPAREEV